MPLTNKGAFRRDDTYWRGASAPTTFYLALVTNAVAPTVDTNTLSELTEVGTGTGYTSGGIAVARSAAGFDVLTEDDTNDRSILQMVDKAFTGAGGNISNAYYAVLTDDNGTVGDREVLMFWALPGAPVSVSDGQTMTIQDAALNTNTNP